MDVCRRSDLSDMHTKFHTNRSSRFGGASDDRHAPRATVHSSQMFASTSGAPPYLRKPDQMWNGKDMDNY